LSYFSSNPHRARSGSAQSALRVQAKLAHEEETNENSKSSSKPDATFKHSLDETLSYAQYDVRNMSLCVINAKNESESIEGGVADNYFAEYQSTFTAPTLCGTRSLNPTPVSVVFGLA
jgi:hypothetical protein